MREYKFRGKRVDNGEWVYGDFTRRKSRYAPQLDTTYGISDEFGIFRAVDPSTIGQSTGLCDKNGKEIYEGDVVGFDDCTSTESGWWEQSCIGVVVWCNETVAFEVTDRLSAESYEVLDECVVIGNIYDNPELLKEGSI